jgi:epoxyqueuosine reductase QueG
MITDSKTDEIREYALSLGADIYGVASAQEYQARFPDKPSPMRFIEDARSIIVIGLSFTASTMGSVLSPELAALEERKEEAMTNPGPPLGAERYFLGEENNMLIRETSYMAYRIAKKLENEGFSAFYVPPFKFDPRFKRAPFYITPAMYLAGLGTMGLNCCILTPEYGPNVLADVIITNRQLPAGQPVDEDLCQTCRRCVKSCPVDAIDGKGWKNVHLCASYGCCGACLAVCPTGRSPADVAAARRMAAEGR